MSTNRPHFSIESITPTKAEQFLKSMPANQRNVNEKAVIIYCDDMLAGKWKTSGPIRFNTKGQMIDGQHRMEAILRSGKTIKFEVIRNCEDDTIQVIDLNRPRTTRDVAKVMSIDFSKQAESVVNLLGTNAEDFSTLRRSRSMSTSSRLEIYEKHKYAVLFATDIQTGQGVFRFAPILAALAKAYYHEEINRLAEFKQVLSTGYCVSGEEDTAAIALRNSYLNAKIKGLTGSDLVRFEFYQKALFSIKCFCAREPRRLIRGAGKEIYPLPVVK